MKPTSEDIREKLREVLDPELHISIVDLGLIYDVLVSDTGRVKVIMTLTTIGCPLFDTIHKEIEDKIMEIPGAEDVEVELTFDPPWDYSKMSESARAELGVE